VSDLDTWLLEQIAADEAAARSAFAGHNQAWPTWSARSGVLATGEGDIDDLIVINDAPIARHMATWDPARALAECETKRRIINMWRKAVPLGPMSLRSVSEHARYVALDEVIGLLALPYADRPGYREEWKP
jgi:hypothetical protein